MEKWEKKEGGLFKALKLGTTFPTTNYVLFDENYKLTKYASGNEILEKFYDLRLKMYEKRKVNNKYFYCLVKVYMVS